MYILNLLGMLSSIAMLYFDRKEDKRIVLRDILILLLWIGAYVKEM